MLTLNTVQNGILVFKVRWCSIEQNVAAHFDLHTVKGVGVSAKREFRFGAIL